jgi:hypothetical protein
MVYHQADSPVLRSVAWIILNFVTAWHMPVCPLPFQSRHSGHACRGSARRLHDIQGHGIFDNGEAPKHRPVSASKLRNIQGSYQFAPPPPGPAPVDPGSPRARRLEDMRSRVFSVASGVLESRGAAAKAKALQFQGESGYG